MATDLEDFEFAIADRFPKAFSRRHTTVLATPGELADHLSAQSGPLGDQRSIKQHAFYFLRALLAAQLKRSREEIGPRTRLDDLMPDPQRRRHDWAAVRASLDIPHFPHLVRASPLEWSIALIVAVSSFAVFLVAGFALGASSAVLALGLGFAGIMCALLLRATEKLATLFSPPTLTVGDLASYAAAYGSKVSSVAIKPTTRSQHLEIVRDLVRLEIGAPEIKDDATWDELLRSSHSAP